MWIITHNLCIEHQFSASYIVMLKAEQIACTRMFLLVGKRDKRDYVIYIIRGYVDGMDKIFSFIRR